MSLAIYSMPFIQLICDLLFKECKTCYRHRRICESGLPLSVMCSG